MVKKVTVSFNCLSDDSVEAFTIDRSTSTSVLRQLWEQKTGNPSSEYSFTFDSGELLPEDSQLNEVIPPHAFLLGIIVVARSSLSVILVGFPDNSWNFPVEFHTTAGDVLEDAKNRLCLDSFSRRVRLLLNGKLIEEEKRIMDHRSLNPEKMQAAVDIEMSFVTVIIRPLEFHPPIFVDGDSLMTDESDLVPAFDKSQEDCVRRIQCFLSESISILADSKVPLNQQRVTSRNCKQTISANATVASLLREDEIFDDCVYLFIEKSLTLFLVKREKPGESITIWPTDKANNFLAEEQRLLIDNEPVENPQQTFLELGLQQGAVVSVVDFITLKISDSLGRMHFLDVNWDMSAAELRQLTDSYEQEPGYQLLCGDWSINKGEVRSLRSLGLRPYSMLRIQFESRPVEFVFEDRVIPVGDVRTSTSFRALLALACARLAAPLPPDCAFVCACGRVVSDENPRRRSFPTRCCEDGGVLSLHVQVPADFEAPATDSVPSISCRLPPVAAFPAIFAQLSVALKPAVDLNTRHRLESILCTILRLQNAKNVCLSFPERIHFVIDMAGEKLPWSAAPSATLSSVLRAVQEHCRVRHAVDFSVRGGRHRLGVLTRPTLTLEAAAIREGQVLKLELPRCQDENTQTASLLCSTGSQTNLYLVIDVVSTSTSYQKPDASIMNASPISVPVPMLGIVDRSPIPSCKLPAVARFYIICNWSNGPEFELKLPVIGNGVDVASLRAEVIGSAPATRSLRQRRGRRRSDAGHVVQTDFKNFAGRDGQLVPKAEVERRVMVRLFDSDPLLLIPGDHSSLIWAYDH